jgi:hypothetical protein
MATTPFRAASDATTFPAPVVMAGMQRAIAAAWQTGRRRAISARPDGVRRSVDRTFVARRLHVVRRDALRRLPRAASPSAPA